jgi:tetratricopeptide (TPR) repeat protein
LKRTDCLVFCTAWLLSVNAANAVETDVTELRALESSTNYAEVVAKLQPLITGPDSENPEVHYYYGRALFRIGKFSKAKEALEKCIGLDSDGWYAKDAREDLDVINNQDSIKGSREKGGKKGYLGLYINRNIVKKVAPNSPAALGRITAGDIIVSINKVPVSATSTDITTRLSGIVGTPVGLVINRSGKQYSCALVTASGILVDGSNELLFEDKGDDASAKVSKRTRSNIVTAPVPTRPTNESDAAFIKVQRQTSETAAAKQKILEGLATSP